MVGCFFQLNLDGNDIVLNPEQEKYFDYTSVKITDTEYDAYQELVYEVAGISLKEKKKPLLTGRLSKRLRYHKIQNYSDYLKLVNADSHELQMMIDLVSTNETSFFREEKRFHFLEDYVKNLDPRRGNFRIWSAACSSGMEAYTTAMVMALIFSIFSRVAIRMASTSCSSLMTSSSNSA